MKADAARELGRGGPDLSNLVHRDYASVLKDIVEPSAAINPDRIAYEISLKAGGSAVGIILEDAPPQLAVGDVAGRSARSRAAMG